MTKKAKYLISFLMLCAVGVAIYLVASQNHREPTLTTATDGRPSPAHTDNGRAHKVIIEVTGNELSAYYDNHVDPLMSDVVSIKIDLTKPDFTVALRNWLHSLGPERLKALQEGNNAEIRIMEEVPEDLVKKIVDVLHEAGITGQSLKNC